MFNLCTRSRTSSPKGIVRFWLAGKLRLMGKYIGHRLAARPEMDNTFWTEYYQSKRYCPVLKAVANVFPHKPEPSSATRIRQYLFEAQFPSVPFHVASRSYCWLLTVFSLPHIFRTSMKMMTSCLLRKKPKKMAGRSLLLKSLTKSTILLPYWRIFKKILSFNVD